MNLDKPYLNRRWFGIVLLAGLTVLLLFHARLSFCQSDESFYLSLAHRLWSGDNLIIDEWHPTQFYAPILLPFYSIFRIIVPDGSGVYLWARIGYILFAFLVSCYIYIYITKEQPFWIGFFASSLPLLYSRANISGPSYYNLCLQFSLLTLILVFSEGNHKIAKYIFSGVTASLAVLCNPYLSIFVFLALVVMLFLPNWRRQALYMGFGVLISAGIYCVAFVPLAEGTELISSLGYVLSDPAHSGVLKKNFLSFLKGIKAYVPNVAFFLVLVACILELFKQFLGKTWKYVGYLNALYLLLALYVVAKVASMSVYSVCFVITVAFSIITFPYTVCAVFSHRKRFALTLYFGGLTMSICWVLASNTWIDAPTAGFCMSSIGAVLLLAPERCNAERGVYKVQISIYLCICVILLGVFSAHRFLGIYRDASVRELSVRIENGPAAGLYTTPEHAEQYEFVHANIVKISEVYTGERVFFTDCLPWAYLSSDMRCASPTSWAVSLADSRLQAYYKSHPLPKIVFIFSEEVGAYGSAKFNNHGGSDTWNKNNFEGEFYQYLLAKGTLLEENSLMKIYRLS